MGVDDIFAFASLGNDNITVDSSGEFCLSWRDSSVDWLTVFAAGGVEAVAPQDKDIIFHVSYQPETGRSVVSPVVGLWT